MTKWKVVILRRIFLEDTVREGCMYYCWSLSYMRTYSFCFQIINFVNFLGVQFKIRIGKVNEHKINSKKIRITGTAAFFFYGLLCLRGN